MSNERSEEAMTAIPEAVERLLKEARQPVNTEDGCFSSSVAAFADKIEAALTAAQQQQQGQAVAWLVEREGDPTFPRAFTCESDADGWVRRVELHPFAKKRPLIYGDTAPPSAPVGVVEWLLADLETIWRSVSDDKETNAAYQRLKAAIAQQPAAVDEVEGLKRLVRHLACNPDFDFVAALATQQQEPTT